VVTPTCFDTKVPSSGNLSKTRVCKSNKYFRRHSPALMAPCRNTYELASDMKCFVICFIAFYFVHLVEFCVFCNVHCDIIIQGVPLATEPDISLIILTPMKILQRNLNSSTFVVWEIKRNVSVSASNFVATSSLLVILLKKCRVR